jgi:type I restriction enzyme S subunit
MTHIEQMIQDLCPDGVEWKTFDELGAFYGGLSGKTKDDFKDGNAKFITYLNIANNPALRLEIDETVKIGPNEKQNIVQYGDALFTGSSETPDECAMSSVVTEYPEEKLYLNSFCFGFRFNSLEGICPAFYKHYFRSDTFRKAVRRTANGTTRFNVSKKEFAKLEIPIPPLEIQQRIVDILDRFSALAAELQAELQMRRKQYEYYRTQLLTPHSDCNSATKSDDCNWDSKPLKELIVSLKTGLNPRTNFKLNTPESNIPYITGKDIYDNVINVTSATDMIDEKARDLINKRACLEGNTLLFASTGTGTVGRMAYVPEYNNDWAMSETLYAIKTKDVLLPRFLMHCLYSPVCRSQFENKISRGSVPHLKVVDLLNVNIPLPPIEEQKRLTELLDKFDKLTTSLYDGIPAEQAAQQKRYEYYRDKLLTFEKRP